MELKSAREPPPRGLRGPTMSEVTHFDGEFWRRLLAVVNKGQGPSQEHALYITQAHAPAKGIPQALAAVAERTGRAALQATLVEPQAVGCALIGDEGVQVPVLDEHLAVPAVGVRDRDLLLEPLQGHPHRHRLHQPVEAHHRLELVPRAHVLEAGHPAEAVADRPGVGRVHRLVGAR